MAWWRRRSAYTIASLKACSCSSLMLASWVSVKAASWAALSSSSTVVVSWPMVVDSAAIVLEVIAGAVRRQASRASAARNWSSACWLAKQARWSARTEAREVGLRAPV